MPLKGYKLQTTIRSNTGELLISKLVAIKISIIQNSNSGNVVYRELHRVASNEFGIVSLTVGEGVPELNLFKDIDWANGPYFQKIELDPQNGSNFLFMGTSQIVSVPISLFAQKSGTSIDDRDKDSLNEIQDLSMNGDEIKLSKSSTSLNLEKYKDNTDSQRISLNGKTLSISGGNSIELAGAVDLDSDPLNEVQSLSLNKDTLKISASNYVVLPNDNDTSANNEIQTISRVGDTISLSKSNSIVLPRNLDNDTLNEIQNLALKTDTLFISKGNSVVIPKYDMTPKGAIITLDTLDLSLLQKGYSYIGKQRVTIQNLLSDSAEWQVTQSLPYFDFKKNLLSIQTVCIGTDIYLYNVIDPSDNSIGFAKYNLNSKTWTALNENSNNAPDRIPASGLAMVWTGTEILFFGGDNFIYRFNPTTGVWSKTLGSNNPGTIYGPSGIWTGTEFIIWGGNKTGVGTVNLGYKFNPISNTWNEISTLNAPQARSGHNAFWNGTHMCILGGQTNLNDSFLYKYQPSTNTWTTQKMINYPESRFSFGLVKVNNEVLIFGGYNSKNSEVQGKVLSYDIQLNTWKNLSSISEEFLYGNSGVTSANSRIFLFGNYNSKNEAWELNKQYGVLSPTMIKYLYLFKKN